MVVASGKVKGKNREALVKGYLSIHPSCAHLCPTLCDSMDYSPPVFSIHGILQARILECPSLGDLPDAGIDPMSPMSTALAGEFFTTSTTWEALCFLCYVVNPVAYLFYVK